jgi:two-component system phosphate regulon sensor histidine kinase PhoR
MKINKYKYITILGLLAVLVLQTLWIRNSYNLTAGDLKKKCDETLVNVMFNEAEGRYNHYLKDSIIDMCAPNSASLNLKYFEDGIYKKSKVDVSLSKMDSLMGKALNQINIHGDYIIYKIDCKRNKIIGVSKKEELGILSIKSKIFYTRINKSQGLQLVLNNPYGTLFERLGFMMLASLIIMIFIIVCIVMQIRIIIRQDNIAKIRKDFSYAMIHDMKSPLSSIMMGISNLQSGKLDDKPDIKNKYLSIMDDESRHLFALINKVLTISKIEENKLTLTKTAVELSPMIHDIAEKYAAKANKPVSFSYDLKAETAFADAEYLKEAVSNLVDNAIKYSKDSVAITVSSRDNDRETMLAVRDNGLGISEKDQQTIFEKFERASAVNRTMNGGASGFGLGLNYVMQVMEAHGGRVHVDSVKGEYSEFTLYIPKEI